MYNINSIIVNSLIIATAFPFIFWSILGGNKQLILGVNSDHIITIYTLVISTILSFTFIITNIEKYTIDRNIVIISFSILFMILLSYLVNNADISIENLMPFFTMLIYGIITINFAIIFQEKNTLFLRIATVALFTTFILLLVSFYYLKLGSWDRLTVPVFENNSWQYFPRGYSSSSDPNVLSYLLVLFTIYITFSVKNIKAKTIINTLVLIIILLTKSRSAILGYFAIIIINNIKYQKIKKTLVYLIILATGVCIYLYFYEKHYIEETINRIFDEGSNQDRLNRLMITLNSLNDISTWLFGNSLGTSGSTVDPHNFYLSTLIDSGMIVLLLIFLIPILFIRKIRDKKLLKCAISLFVFFLIISMFYWQLRTYFILLLLLILLNQKDQFILQTSKDSNS